MKRNKFIGTWMMAATVLVASSCTDFDDYNDVPVDSNPVAGKTLWENIAGQDNLQQFRELAEKAGMKDLLNSARFYTVWAPIDNTYDYSKLSTLDSATLRNQFMNNHVAEYRHAASGDMTGEHAERVMMLNKKKLELTGSGQNFTFGDVALDEANLPAVNGVLHTLKGKTSFLYNLREFMAQLQNADSLKNYYAHHYRRTLDKSQSVIGPLDSLGRQTYLDSVFTESNRLESLLDAMFVEEDSSYTILIPTDNAFDEAYARIRPAFNYVAAMKYQDLSLSRSTSTTEINKATQSVVFPTSPYVYNPELWTDSLVRMSIFRDMVFSNNLTKNECLSEEQFTSKDTLLSTTGGYRLTLNQKQIPVGKLSNPAELLQKKVGETVKLSNGQAMYVDSLAVHPWESFVTPVIIDPDRNKAVLSDGRPPQAKTQSVTVRKENTAKSSWIKKDYRYLMVEPLDEFSQPEFYVYLPGVQSVEYDFYVTMIPGDIDQEDTTAIVKPNCLNFELNYCDEKGALQNWRFSSDGVQNPTAKQQKPFVTDTSKVQLLHLGSFKFPVSYATLGSKYAPNLKMKSVYSPFDFEIGIDSTYTLTMRIGEILLIPKEANDAVLPLWEHVKDDSSSRSYYPLTVNKNATKEEY
jgi:uncharacterized surface protein with fasciclin (FAS1) repeats